MVDRNKQIAFWERDQSKRRDPGHPIVCAIVGPKIELIKRYISLSNKNILDVGSGNGYFAHHLSKYTKVVASDISETLLKMNPVTRKVKCDAENLPFKAGCFDVVLSSNLLHHVSNPKKVIREMHRVSREYVVLSDANRNNLFLFIFSLIKKQERGALKISIRYLQELIEALNMRLVVCTTMGFIVPNFTPLPLLPFFKRMEEVLVSIFGGIYSVVISKKT